MTLYVLYFQFNPVCMGQTCLDLFVFLFAHEIEFEGLAIRSSIVPFVGWIQEVLQVDPANDLNL